MTCCCSTMILLVSEVIFWYPLKSTDNSAGTCMGIITQVPSADIFLVGECGKARARVSDNSLCACPSI